MYNVFYNLKFCSSRDTINKVINEEELRKAVYNTHL